MVEIWPKLAELAPIIRFRARLVTLVPSLVDLGSNLAEAGQIGPTLARRML